ncbi:MAG: DUF2845 domain-containing protein [Chitinispirillaceae bacterium]|nr:DUF2845 domain-containing protein [Chitinispirillaceae bacterium]
MKAFACLIGAMALSMPSFSYSESSYRCGSKIITVGTAMQIVKLHCGDPEERDIIGEITKKPAVIDALRPVLSISFPARTCGIHCLCLYRAGTGFRK